ncbi:MAG: FtsX-like permease family protein, partial [Gemmatimonadaceae bacterium]
VNSVDRSYFATMGMTLQQGSTFSDTTAAANQVIVNEGFARKHWPGSALGRRIRIVQKDGGPWMTIVGVVRSARMNGPGSESTAPVLYSPRSEAGSAPSVLVRTTGGAETLAPVIAILGQMGVKRMPPIQNVSETMSRNIAGPRFIMLLLTILTGLALVLAAVGLYGVMSYSVAEQTREIGIRVALGASGDRIARRVIGAGVGLAVVGAIIGLGVAAWGTRLIETQLHGVERLDPASFAVGGAVLIGAALVACIVPTRRALAVDPMTAIRAD